MKLRIATPLQLVIELDDVASIRAEDESGAFGVLLGHTNFLTVLPASVVSWKNDKGRETHAAIRGGVFQVYAGSTIDIATRDAIVGESLSVLKSDVLARFREEEAFEELSKTSAARLNLTIIRQLQKYLEAGQMRITMAHHRASEKYSVSADAGKEL